MGNEAHVLLAGASGVPGRNILSSLIAFKEANSWADFTITVLKRASVRRSISEGSGEGASDQVGAANETANETSEKPYVVAYVENFSDIGGLAHTIHDIAPDIIISALNAEPEPLLDNRLIDALTNPHAWDPSREHPFFFINGFTLDLLNRCVAWLPAPALEKLKPKIDFAHRLESVSRMGKIEYCTIVNASFLDYTLVKGYAGINLSTKTAKIFDGGDKSMTGCSLQFVGDAVAEVVRRVLYGSQFDREDLMNQRLHIAEVEFTGLGLLETVKEVTGDEFEVEDVDTSSFLETGHPITKLAWDGNGAASLQDYGLKFGLHEGLKGKRRRECFDLALLMHQPEGHVLHYP